MQHVLPLVAIRTCCTEAPTRPKIVVSLRDPVARIYSHYLMARKYGHVKGSVVEAVKADLAHPDPSWGRSELFVELSLYMKPKSPDGAPVSRTTNSWCSSLAPFARTRRGTTCKRGWD